MLTVSRKSERLVNLTIALLATKRFLTKSEIFRSIEGYEGSDESKERMFERDKDDLRSIGIDIEVGGLDPLFNDEAGYRIKPEKYALDIGEVSGVDIALLSLAAQAWNGQALNSVANSALLKLKSIGIDSDIESIPTLAPKMAWSTQELATVLEAIATRRAIRFTYLSSDLEPQQREIQPYVLSSREGHWYFGGLDLARKSNRTFRLDRILGDVIFFSKPAAFEIPQGFDLFAAIDQQNPAITAVLDIRKGKASALRKNATVVQERGEWDRVHIDYVDPSSFTDSLLWHIDDVVVIEPKEIQSSIIEILRTLVALHD